MPSSSASFAARAIVSLVLLAGFYVLSLSIVAALLWIPYAEWTYAHRVHLKLLIGCLGGALVILRATLFVRTPKFEPPGPELTAAEQPRLFAVIRKIADRMHSGMPRHVYLVPDVNAFVTEVGGFMGFGATRVMGIGVGLLSVDTVSQLEATIAHEFGHFAGGDTRLGGIVYRTRAAIGRVLESLRESWLSKPFRLYGELFMRITRGMSRQQELEADRASVEIAGKEAQITGLAREMRGGVLFDQFLSTEVAPLLRRGYRPENLYDGFRDYARALEDQKKVAELDAALARAKTGKYDAHPSLSERIAFANALQVSEVRQDLRSARELLEEPTRVERDVTDAVASRWADGGVLQATGWAEAAARVYAPMMKEQGELYAERLSKTSPEGSSDAALRALLASLGSQSDELTAMAVEPELASMEPSERAELAPQVLANALAALLGKALIARGGEWRSEVGRPLEIAIGGQLVAPFQLAQAAIGDRSGLSEIRRNFGLD